MSLLNYPPVNSIEDCEPRNLLFLLRWKVTYRDLLITPEPTSHVVDLVPLMESDIIYRGEGGVIPIHLRDILCFLGYQNSNYPEP